jgi:hypothetical protein
MHWQAASNLLLFNRGVMRLATPQPAVPRDEGASWHSWNPVLLLPAAVLNSGSSSWNFLCTAIHQICWRVMMPSTM